MKYSSLGSKISGNRAQRLFAEKMGVGRYKCQGEKGSVSSVRLGDKGKLVWPWEYRYRMEQEQVGEVEGQKNGGIRYSLVSGLTGVCIVS